ncbi:MAG: PEP-CTERM sorting domain-containing protein [Cyanobacteriota bacterium]|nr:PEP-CTERM sorting domain-containing protein [Cyanobacteriota bacterium]
MSTLLAKIAIATAVGTAFSLGAMNAAEAASFNFSYTLDNGDLLSGMLEGDVQADGDTVLVSEITMPMFNNAPAPELTFFESALEFLAGIPGSPVVSFSGLTMDIIACDTSACDNGFAFEGSGLFTVPAYISSGFYGDASEIYDPARWELAAKTTPEPASMLGLLAVGALGAAAKLKSAKKQNA